MLLFPGWDYFSFGLCNLKRELPWWGHPTQGQCAIGCDHCSLATDADYRSKPDTSSAVRALFCWGWWCKCGFLQSGTGSWLPGWRAPGYAVVTRWWPRWHISGTSQKLIQIGSLACCCLEYKVGIGCSVVTLTMQPRPVKNPSLKFLHYGREQDPDFQSGFSLSTANHLQCLGKLACHIQVNVCSLKIRKHFQIL